MSRLRYSLGIGGGLGAVCVVLAGLAPAGSSFEVAPDLRAEVVVVGVPRPVQLAVDASARLVILSHGWRGDDAAEIYRLELAALPLDASRTPRVVVPFSGGPRKAAFGSLALHIGLPLMGGVAGIYGGQAACHRGGWDCPMTAIGVGVLAGAVTATLVDSAFLAHVERPVPRRAPGVPVPTVAMAPGGGVVLGVAGRL